MTKGAFLCCIVCGKENFSGYRRSFVKWGPIRKSDQGGRCSTGLGSKGGAVLRALNFHLCGLGSNPLAILLVCAV